MSLILKCNRQLEHSSVPSELHTQHHVILAITVERRLGTHRDDCEYQFSSHADNISQSDWMHGATSASARHIDDTTSNAMAWSRDSTDNGINLHQQNALASNFVHSCAITWEDCERLSTVSLVWSANRRKFDPCGLVGDCFSRRLHRPNKKFMSNAVNVWWNGKGWSKMKLELECELRFGWPTRFVVLVSFCFCFRM